MKISEKVHITIHFKLTIKKYIEDYFIKSRNSIEQQNKNLKNVKLQS